MVNSGFHTRRKFSENYLQFEHVPPEVPPVLGRKDLGGAKILACQGKKIIDERGAFTCHVPALAVVKAKAFWNLTLFSLTDTRQPVDLIIRADE
jgi:hypothetical protein